MGSMTDDDAPDSTVPDSLVMKLRAWERRDRDHASKWRENALRDFDFVAGNQWSEDDRAALAEQLRVPITFNRIDAQVSAISGAEIQNRQEVKYIPRTVEDTGVNEVLTAAAKYFRDECDAEDEESESYRDLVICGMGWTETRLDVEGNPSGDVVIERVDPLEMGWDCSAKKRNLGDARHVWRARMFSKDEIVSRWPDADIDELSASGGGDDDQTGAHYREPGKAYEGGGPSGKATDGKYRVVHFQWIEVTKEYAVADPLTGGITQLAPEAHDSLKKEFEARGMPFQSAPVAKKVYREAFYCGDTMLYEGDCPVNGFTLKAMTGKRDRNSNTWYGIVRLLRDPQMWANKWLSQMLHIINSNAKGGLIAEVGAFEDPRQAEDTWAKADAITWAADGAVTGGRIMPKQAPAWPSQLERLMEFAIQSGPQITGVNFEMMGAADRNQPGVLEYQRRQSGYAVLAVFFDSLRRYRKEQGRILLEFITKYLNDGRLVRIVGKDGEKYVPMAFDPQVTQYDVIVDAAPTSPNQKEAAWMVMQPIIAMFKDRLPPQVLVEALRYSPVPDSFASKIAEFVNAPPTPEQQMQKVIQARGAMAQVAKDEKTVELTDAKAQKERVGAMRDALTPINPSQTVNIV